MSSGLGGIYLTSSQRTLDRARPAAWHPTGRGRFRSGPRSSLERPFSGRSSMTSNPWRPKVISGSTLPETLPSADSLDVFPSVRPQRRLRSRRRPPRFALGEARRATRDARPRTASGPQPLARQDLAGRCAQRPHRARPAGGHGAPATHAIRPPPLGSGGLPARRQNPRTRASATRAAASAGPERACSVQAWGAGHRWALGRPLARRRPHRPHPQLAESFGRDTYQDAVFN